MRINSSCPLVLRDLYFYDIKSCYPQLLSSIHYKLSSDLTNKKVRNIEIGKIQIGNENLSSFLQGATENLIEFYLRENNITEKEIIVLQKDGFIISRMLTETDIFITMDFRKFIDSMIISTDRKKMLYVCGEEVITKGIPNNYKSMYKIYKKFSSLDFYNKPRLFSQLQAIKDSIFNSKDKKLFMIPNDKNYTILTKKYGTLKVINEKIFKIEDIDKLKYYNHYFRGLMDSIFLEFY